MSIQNLTRSDIRTDVRRRLNEAGIAGVWSDAEINTRIDRAVLRVQMSTEEDTTESTIYIRNGVAWYSLPSDCMVPLFLYGPSVWSYGRIFPSDWTKLDKANLEWKTNTVAQSMLFVPFSDNRFILWPAPNITSSISLFYVPVPTALANDNSTTNFPLSAQKLIPIYTAYLCLRKHDFEKAKIFLSEFKQRLAVARAEKETRSQSHPSRMAPAKQFDRRQVTPSAFGMGRR